LPEFAPDQHQFSANRKDLRIATAEISDRLFPGNHLVSRSKKRFVALPKHLNELRFGAAKQQKLIPFRPPGKTI
jgi:hypothetical protein